MVNSPPSSIGRLRAAHFLILLLLIPPGAAVHRLYGSEILGWTAGWVAAISIVTWFIYAADKRKARHNDWRIPETRLHFCSLLGGWPGAFLAQRVLRHKSAKGSFQFIFLLIIGLHQIIALDALRGWPLAQTLRDALRMAAR